MTVEIFTSGGRSPAHDLAAEAWLLDRAASGRVCALASSWSGPVVVLGFGQSAEQVDLEWCRGRGVPVLRRITGGTGVIHHGDLGFSLALPIAHPWAKGITRLYERFLGVLEPGLRRLGSEARRMAEPEKVGRDRSPICFEDQSADTLLIKGRKVVGCAQTRRREAVLIHAAILLGLEPELYARVFRVERARVEAGLGPALNGRRWETVAESLGASLGEALGEPVDRRTLPPLDERWLAPWSTEKWAPAP